LNESTEKTRYIQKVLALANSSRHYIERLWRIKIDVSRFSDFMAPLFYSITNTLAKAATQLMSYSGTIRELSLTRIIFLPPFDFFFRKATPPEEEFAPIEMGRANVSFLFNVNVARKTARKLTERVATKTPESALTLAPLLFEGEVIEKGAEETAETVPNIISDFQSSYASKIAPSIKSMSLALTSVSLLSEAEVIKEGLEKPAKGAYPIVADFQTSFKSKIAPSTKSARSALQKISGQTILPASLLAISKPLITIPSRFDGLPYHPPAAPQVSFIEKSLPVSPPVTSYPHKEMKVEFLTLISIPLIQFGAEATRSFGYATGLPKILMQQEIPILRRSTAAFRPVSAATTVESIESPVSMPVERLRSDVVGPLESVVKLASYVFDQKIPILSSLVLSTVSTPKEPLLTIEPAPTYARAVPPPSVRPSLRSSSLKEDAPDLTAWVYNISKVLRTATLGLLAVQTAASTAEKIIMGTILQPVSSVEAPWSLTTHEPDWAPSRPETEEKPIEVEAFKLPQILASLAVGLGQQYPLLIGEPEIAETLAPTFELAGVAPEETLPLATMPEVKTFSKLSTLVALASTESLIAQRLQEESSMLIEGMHVARSLSGETLTGLGAFSPTRTTTVSRMAAAPILFPPRAAPTHWGPPATQRPSKPVAVRPTVQNTFNITIAAESTKEDLRDLEKKISRILSDQIRRYYGSTRI